jgi:class 3 adenylate cyclase/PAS domain-containing protein
MTPVSARSRSDPAVSTGPGPLRRRPRWRGNAIGNAIADAATRIVVGRDWRHGLQELLGRLGQATGVSRVTLFETHPGPSCRLVESCRYDWAEPGIAPLSTDPRCQNMAVVDERGELDEWTRRRQRGEVVMATLRQVIGYDRQVFIEQGVRSFVSVPIMLRRGYWGFLGFDDCKTERAWSRHEIDMLGTAGGLIAGAMERAETDERLRASEERYALAARGANDGLWDWNVVTDRAYYSPRLHEILGWAEGALAPSMAALLKQFDRDDEKAVRDYFVARFRQRRRRFEFEARQQTSLTAPRWFAARGLIVYADDRPVRVVGSLRDITDHKLAITQLAEAERQRTSLTRYFSPNVVDEVMRAGGRIVAVRSLDATVLFADLVNYTEMSSSLPGEQVLELLREFHRLVEDAVFGNEGTLDKYMGDGLMATFGTPRPGLRDATNAVACARHLISAVKRWNERRALTALPKIQISVGLHFGEVTLGDVGSDRRFEFTAVGHTVNLASRIEAASRALQTEIVASDAVVAAVRREGGDAILAGFENLGSHPVRGSRVPIGLWGLTNGA